MELVTLRTRDLTPPTPLSGISYRPGLPPIKLEDYGGSEHFYRFLMEELLPAFAAAYPLNTEDKTLYVTSSGASTGERSGRLSWGCVPTGGVRVRPVFGSNCCAITARCTTAALTSRLYHLLRRPI